MIFARRAPPQKDEGGECPRRRLTRFSLRSLFVLMTLVALFCGWTLAQMRSREQLLESFRGRGIIVAMDLGTSRNPARRGSSWTTPAAWFRPVRSISVERGKLAPAELDKLQNAFPESNVTEASFY
jgi:hypothetical protein